MFTGLIEHIGVVALRTPRDPASGDGFTLTFSSCAPVLGDCSVGDSIAVNGACLTVTEFDADSFKVGLAPETLDRTNLGELREGDRVNLERAMTASTRFGGHVVQGHVDTTATILSITPDGNSIRYLFSLPASTPNGLSTLRSLIPKGYVALDGTSLTLTSVSDADATFGIMLIEHSQGKVILAQKKVGDRVNVEGDAVGKAVVRAVERALGGAGDGDDEGESAGGGGVERAIERVLERRKREGKD